jgi:hypothetical protein
MQKQMKRIKQKEDLVMAHMGLGSKRTKALKRFSVTKQLQMIGDAVRGKKK